MRLQPIEYKKMQVRARHSWKHSVGKYLAVITSPLNDAAVIGPAQSKLIIIINFSVLM
jgi:hypothetical protein